MTRSARIAMVMLLLTATACTGGGPSVKPPPATTPAAPAKVKYEALLTCAQVTQQVAGLPPFRTGNEKPSLSDLLTGCEFQRIPDWPRINLQASAWRNDPDSTYPPATGRGRGKARDAFDAPARPGSDPADDGAADVGVGEQAKWLTPKDTDSCTLMILDDNAVLTLQNKPADKPQPRSDECRGPLREFAKSFYASLQPR
ncbi:hypothetical protein ACFWNN_07460 [Lentzea sp. NPDC058450]|uniref:hypothetical protein n=1 Tax=Lentzea sp. NPDC058450 TaxID=3346505 RepID=UPI00365DADD0